MAMKYAVIGAGGMGIQYGVLLQEFAHKDVDFIDTWKPNVEKIREQGGAYVSQDGEDRHLVPIDVYYPEEYTGGRTRGSYSSSRCSSTACSSAARICSTTDRSCSPR